MNRLNNNYTGNIKNANPNKQQNEVGYPSPRQYPESSPPTELNDDLLPMSVSSPAHSSQNYNAGIKIPMTPLARSDVSSPAHSSQNYNIGMKIPMTPLAQGMRPRMPMPQPVVAGHNPRPAYNPSAAKSPHQHTANLSQQPGPSRAFDHGQGPQVRTMNTNTNPVEADRQLGYCRPTTKQLRCQVQEVLRSYTTYPLVECHDKVKWFGTVMLHQLLDLELYRASSLAFEQQTNQQLKRLIPLERRTKMLLLEKKKFEQREKQWGEERTQFQKKNEELVEQKGQLETNVKVLKQFETRFQDVKKQGDELKSEIFQMTQELDEERKKSAELEEKRKTAEAERDDYRKRLKEIGKQEMEAKRQIRELEEKLEAEKNSKKKMTGVEGVDEAKWKEMKRMVKTKSAELEKVQEKLKEREDGQQKMEEQLKEAKAKAEEHKHAEMLVKEKLRRRTERAKAKIEEQQAKIEEQQKQMEEERTRMEERMRKMREEKKKSKQPKQRPDEETVDEGQLGANALEIAQKKRQLDKAIAAIAMKQKKNCENCAKWENEKMQLNAQIVKKDAEMEEMRKQQRTPRVTIRMMDPNSGEQTGHEKQQQQQEARKDESQRREVEAIPEEGEAIQEVGTIVQNQEIHEVEEVQQDEMEIERHEENHQQQQQQQMEEQQQPISSLEDEANASRKRNAEEAELMMGGREHDKRTRSDDTVTLSSCASLVPTESSSSPNSPAITVKSEPTLAEPAAEQQLQYQDGPSVGVGQLLNGGGAVPNPTLTRIMNSPAQSPLIINSRHLQPASPAGTGVHQPQDKNRHGANSVLTLHQPMAVEQLIVTGQPHVPPPFSSSKMPSSSSTSSPSPRHPFLVQSSSPRPSPLPASPRTNAANEKLAATQIVTNFMLFVSHHPDRNTQSLIPEYLQQSGIPQQFQHLIFEQLKLIAAASEQVRTQI